MKQNLSFLLILVAMIANGQQYLGVQTWGGTNTDQLNGLALDAQERPFAVGGFRGTADMDPGPGEWPLTATGESQDIFLSRFTAEAVFEWSVALGGTGHDFAKGLAVHGSGVYVGGEFEGTLDAEGVILSSAGDSDVLLAKYTLDGVLLWAVSAGSTGSDYINDIAMDTEGNVIAIGYFQGTVDFDPGPDAFPIAAGGTDAMFLWKLSPAGALISVATWNGSSSENGTAVATGATNDIWIGGGYYSTLDLDPGAGTMSVTAPGFDQNAFLIHLDADLDFIWGGHMGGNGTDIIEDMLVTANGDVIAIGHFGGDGDYDPGPGVTTLTNMGGPDSFVLRLSQSGELVWARSFGSTVYDVPNAVVSGTGGELQISGGFDGTMDMDPGAGVASFTSNGSADVYLLMLDANGEYMQGASWGGTGFDNGSALAWNQLDQRFVGGFFEYNVDFDPGTGTDPVQSILNSRDAFLSRLCTPFSIEQDSLICFGDSAFIAGEWQTETGEYTDEYTATNGCDSVIVTNLMVEICTDINENGEALIMRLFPNPASEQIIIHLNAPSPGGTIEILDRSGKQVRTAEVARGTVQVIDVADLPAGVYTVGISGGVVGQLNFVKE